MQMYVVHDADGNIVAATSVVAPVAAGEGHLLQAVPVPKPGQHLITIDAPEYSADMSLRDFLAGRKIATQGGQQRFVEA